MNGDLKDLILSCNVHNFHGIDNFIKWQPVLDDLIETQIPHPRNEQQIEDFWNTVKDIAIKYGFRENDLGTVIDAIDKWYFMYTQ